MTWTTDDRRQAASLLLGSWPGTMAAWGREAITAYLAVLEARGLTAEQVRAAILAWPAGSDFPPSAPNLAAAALNDPATPTFDELLTLIRTALRATTLPLHGDFSNEAQMIQAREQRVLERAEGMHPLVFSFIARHGVRRLQVEVGDLDGDYGAIRRNELAAAWDEHRDRMRDRDVHAISAGQRRGELGRFDPLAALGPVARPAAGELTKGGGDR